eukprot:3238014-Pyramimonas_sp.AAC.1
MAEQRRAHQRPCNLCQVLQRACRPVGRAWRGRGLFCRLARRGEGALRDRRLAGGGMPRPRPLLRTLAAGQGRPARRPTPVRRSYSSSRPTPRQPHERSANAPTLASHLAQG